MNDMLERQQGIEVYEGFLLSQTKLTINQVEAAEIHSTLQSHLLAITQLQDTYISYRSAYGNLVLEMERRKQFREALEGIIKGMNGQLHAMRDGKKTSQIQSDF